MMVIGAQSLNLVTYFARWKKDLPRIAELTLQNMTMDQAALMIKNGQTAELTKQVLLQGTLNILQGIFNGLLGVAKFLFTSIPGLIITAVAALAGLIYAYKNWWSEEARLNKELEKTKENLEASQKAYSELVSNISNYNSAVEGIKNLTEGTVEFYEAIIKSNEEAKKLIEQLDLIAGKDYQ